MSLFEPNLTSEELEDVFEDFEIIEFIGSGGQGEIWRVNSAGYDWALKIYPLEISMPVRIDREIEAFSSLNSDHIVKLHLHGTTEIRGQECRYYCMDYCHGNSLKEIVNGNQLLDNNDLKRLISQVGNAIQTLWDLRIVHRDIKPGNILKNGDDYILIDLGCARHLNKITVTQNGRTMGTLGYMSPEQMRCRKGLTLKSDFFSLGIVAYEVITGIHPFSKRQDFIMSTNPTPIQEIINIPDDIARCIHSLLKKRIVERPNSIAEINHILN